MSKKTTVQLTLQHNQEPAASTWIDCPHALAPTGLEDGSQVEIHSGEIPVSKVYMSAASYYSGGSIATSRLREACYERLCAPILVRRLVMLTFRRSWRRPPLHSGQDTTRVDRWPFKGKEQDRSKGVGS